MVLAALGVVTVTQPWTSATVERSTYIVQGRDSAEAIRAIEAVGGAVEHELSVIDGASAQLTSEQARNLLAANPWLKSYRNRAIRVAGDVPETSYPTLVQAATLHRGGINGRGVTIAVLDTGLWKKSGTQYTTDQKERIVAQYDVIAGRKDPGKYKSGDYKQDIDDTSGHGTHVGSIAISSDRTRAGRYQGVAPSANIIAVRAFGTDGSATYADVIKGLDWIVANRAKYKIRILNLSFSAEAASAYWADPLNQAVMKAWRDGIVVVASSGNAGPDPGTIGVPGNVPYVITVGAMTDAYTPSNPQDDRLATFSSSGPTAEGFVKPEVVAPGGHMLAWMPPHGFISKTFPQFAHKDKVYFTMSGTSQSAAVVSGIAALMLQVNPALTPDEVKCRLMSTARPAVNASGEASYSVLQQGAGLVDAWQATYSVNRGCANVGLDVAADLRGEKHFAGPIRLDDNGELYLVGPDGERLDGTGYLWSRQYADNQGYLWSRGSILQQGYLWSHSWAYQQGYLWSRGFLWSKKSGAVPNVRSSSVTAFPTSAGVAGINNWVNPE